MGGAGNRRILQLVQTMEVGGLERVVANLSGALRQEGWYVDLACLSHGGVMASRSSYDNLWVGHLSEIIKPLDVFCLYRLCRRIRKMRPSVIHSHNPQALLYGFLASWIMGVPHVHTLHGRGGGNPEAENRKARMRRWAARSTSAFVAVSSDIYRKITEQDGILKNKTITILNGVDTERFRRSREAAVARELVGIPADAIVAGSIGRLSPEKNYSLLVRAFARLVDQNEASSPVLLLVGDGPSREAIQDEVAKLGIGRHVVLPGNQEDVFPWLEAMDVFCLSSDSEGTPVALLEAGALGLPLIVTRVGGCPEVVKDGATGYIVEGGDVEGYANALAELFCDARKRNTMGQAARAHIEHDYSQKATVSDYIALYEQVIKSKQRSGGES